MADGSGTAEPWYVEVLAASKVYTPTKHVVYTIAVSPTPSEPPYLIYRRYNDLFEMQKKLLATFPVEAGNAGRPRYGCERALPRRSAPRRRSRRLGFGAADARRRPQDHPVHARKADSAAGPEQAGAGQVAHRGLQRVLLRTAVKHCDAQAPSRR